MSETLVAKTERADGMVSSAATTNTIGSVNKAMKVWPASIAPAYREFKAKCESGSATRGDLIALKKFIAASSLDGAAKTNLTQQVRMLYQKMKRRK